MPFRDRREAGRLLAQHLTAYVQRPDVLVLGLPRGGVPVAYEVALALDAALDVFLVRKLGAPGQEELAMGAIATGGIRVLNAAVLRQLGIAPETVEAATRRERDELERRERLYRGDRPEPCVRGRVAILVDDGIATGASVRAALTALAALGPSRRVVAVPVAAADTCRELETLADEVVCAVAPEQFHAVGLWYEDFSPTSEEEVRSLLAEAARGHPVPTQPYIPIAANTEQTAPYPGS